MHANLAMAGLIRSADTYFQDTAREAVKQMIGFMTPKAKSLQKGYYDHLAACAADPKISKRRFLIEVTNKMVSSTDYHCVKFEVEKIHTLCYSTHHDAAALMPFLLKVFDREVLGLLLDLFEVLSTIKPSYDFVQRGSASERQGSPFVLFAQIFNVLISHGRDGSGAQAVELFESRLRASCKGLDDIFSEDDKQNDEDQKESKAPSKKRDLLEFLKIEKDKAKRVPEICEIQNKSLSKIEVTNVRGYLVASVLIVGQYISIFEGTRKATQESLCLTRSWSKELRILSSFLTEFNECNHQITDAFFRDQ